MTNSPADYAKNHWRQFESDAEHAERVERAEAETQPWFNRATVRQLAAHRAAMKALQSLPADQRDAARDRANAIWSETTKAARDLFNVTCDDIMRDGEPSEATDAAWDALLDLRAAVQAEAA